MVGSANLNVMIKAARRAGRSLVKDFREVENLQVSMKGAGDFVSKADLAAEAILKEDLLGARPNYGWLAEEGVERRGVIARDAQPAVAGVERLEFVGRVRIAAGRGDGPLAFEQRAGMTQTQSAIGAGDEGVRHGGTP